MLDAFEKLAEIGFKEVIFVILLLIIFVPSLYKNLKEFINMCKDLLTRRDKFEAKQQEQIDDVVDDVDAKIKHFEDEIIDKQESYHQQSIDIRNGIMSGQEKNTENIKSLSNNQRRLEESNKILQEAITTLTRKLDDYIELDRETSVASLRYELYGMHKEFMKQKYVTTEGLKTFMELSDIYEKKGGDDILHDRLKPDVLKLPIKYTDDLL